MPKDKRPRKKLLKEPDEFISTTARVFQWLRGNLKWVAVGGSLFLLLGIGTWAWWQHKQKLEVQGQEAFALAYQLYHTAMEQQDDSASKDLLKKTVTRLEEVMEEYAGTRAAWMASLYKAHALFELEEYTESAKQYQRIIEQAPSEEMRFMVLQRLGYTFLASGEISKAIEIFERLKGEAPEGIKRMAKWSLAICYERKGETQKALEFYRELRDSLPEGFSKLMAKIKVSELSNQVEGKKAE